MTRRPRVLFLNHNFKGEGTYLRCYHLGRRLARLGWEIDLVCADNARGRFSTRIEEVEPGFRVIALPRLGKGARYVGYGVRALLGLPYALSGRYDLVHAFAAAIPSTALPAIASRLMAKKVLIDWDDAWAGGLADYAHPLAAKAASWLEAETPRLANAAGITVVSDYLQRRAHGLYPGLPVHKVMNGADAAAIHPVKKEEARRALGIPEGETVVLSMGRTYTRSLEIMLGAFEKLLEEKPGAKLHVVGDICMYGALRDYVAFTKKRFQRLNGSVVYTGNVPYEKLKYHLSAADVLLLPMEECVHEVSRFPIRFGDYLAAGNIIVSNAVGEVKTLMESYRAGLVADAGGMDDFAAKIAEGLAHAPLQNGYKTRARNLATGDLSWEMMAQNMDAVYRFHLCGVPLPAPTAAASEAKAEPEPAAASAPSLPAA